MHLEADLQRRGTPSISTENSRPSQKKQPCCHGSSDMIAEERRSKGRRRHFACSHLSSPPVLFLLQQNKERANSDSNIKTEKPCSSKQEPPSSKAGKKILS